MWFVRKTYSDYFTISELVLWFGENVIFKWFYSCFNIVVF